MSSEHGFIVVRHGKPVDQPAAAGDKVDVYPLDQPLAFIAGEGTALDLELAHEQAARLGDAVAAASKRMRLLGFIDCECGSTTKRLARLVQDKQGCTWIVPAVEKVPAAFRSERVVSEPAAWPLHGHGQAPHVIPTSCRACGRRFLLALSSRGVTRLGVSGARHARRVVE